MKNIPKPSDKATDEKISINVLKSSNFCYSNPAKYISEAFSDKKFLDTLKLPDIAPVYKQLDTRDKANYRPASIFPLVPKLLKKLSMTNLMYKLNTFPIGFYVASIGLIPSNMFI